MAPGSNGVESDGHDLVGAKHGLGGLPAPLVLTERMREAARRQERNVVVSRHGEHREAECTEELGRLLVLVGPSPVREVPGGDDQLRPAVLDQLAQSRLHPRFFAGADVEVGDVEQPGHRRTRLYTRSVEDESTEIFDDLYLGLRAGGALRKQRRGEALTAEEQQAIGRWQRLSAWRKAVAVGAFALGTFGLGFTLGGLVFGRWRRA